MLVCFLQLVTAIAVFNIPSVAITKESNATLANCSFRFTWADDIGASVPSSLEEDEELEESSESLLSFLASLEFPDAATSLDFSDAAYIGLDWCSLLGLDRRSLVGIHWRSLLRVHWCSHAKDNEQVALQAEVYKQKYIITRTVFVDKFERWLANHYLGHLLKFLTRKRGKVLSNGESQLISQVAADLSQRAGGGLWALARPSFLEASQRQSWCWHKAFQASSTPRLPLLLALRRMVSICTAMSFTVISFLYIEQRLKRQQELEELGMLLAVLLTASTFPSLPGWCALSCSQKLPHQA